MEGGDFPDAFSGLTLTVRWTATGTQNLLIFEVDFLGPPQGPLEIRLTKVITLLTKTNDIVRQQGPKTLGGENCF